MNNTHKMIALTSTIALAIVLTAIFESKSMYIEKEITYSNPLAGITLAGTLTLPTTTKPCPVAFLIAGMGPIDHDGTNYYGHKPLLILANDLAKKGIATLRIDKRGVGKSTGTFDLTVTPDDLATDVASGIEFLKSCTEINPNQIGVIGHSEGGLVAAMVATQSTNIAFVVLMAAAINNNTTLEQVAVQLRADGASEDVIERDSTVRHDIFEIIQQHPTSEETIKKLHTVIANYWTTLSEEQKAEIQALPWALSLPTADSAISFMASPYYRFMLTYDASATLAKITVPLLALYGEHDFMAPHIMLPLIKKAIEKSGNEKVTLLKMPKLNHSFQTCQTGAMAEYATIKETLAPEVLEIIGQWILNTL